MHRCRRTALLLAVVLAVLASRPAGAAVGINLYGLSWHPSSNRYSGENPGAGVRYQFLRRPGWKADALAGGYRDSVGDLMLHAALGWQKRLAGRVYLGAHLVVMARGQALDELSVGPLPSVSFEAGPVDLHVHYLPRLAVESVRSSSAAVGFHATFWPFGGRGPTSQAAPPADGRVALEFGVASGSSLTALDDHVLSLRWQPSPERGWRLGLQLDLRRERFSSTTVDDGRHDEFERTYENGWVRAEVQRLWIFPSSRGTRFLLGIGPVLDWQYSTYDTEWRPGARLVLGAEVDLVRGLSLLAESRTSALWDVDDDDIGSESNGVEITAGTKLGVALWW